MKVVPTPKTGVCVGIDLGTSNSLVAIMQDGRPVVLENALGSLLTPSVVSFDDDGQVLVGAAARARASSHAGQTARLFKRDMGTDRDVRVGERSMRPEELSALVLESLKRDAEAVLGQEVTEAVVTVPAYFGDKQRNATRDAGTIAGIRIERIINEPTAAALAYGLHHSDKELQAVVLDLGGGTFDVTVLEIIEGVIEIQATAGDARLGGEDFAEALASVVVKELADEGFEIEGDAPALARIRDAAELAKRRLSESPEASVLVSRLDAKAGTTSVDRTFTRQEAEGLWAPLLERMRVPIRRAIRDAGLSIDEIDEVLLVGGATRMPCFVQLAADTFGRAPLDTLPADEAVAMGAAIQAALKQGDASVDDMVVTDVAPFSLGIASSIRMGRQNIDGMYSPILDRGTTIPASRSAQFFTMEDGQRMLDIVVYQGEHSLCKDNTLLGKYTLKGLPRKPAGQAGVDVRFTYDLNGILEIEMKIIGQDKVEHLVIEQSPGSLSKREVEAARRSMAALKFHPRETLPNRTLLARGDALFGELKGVARDDLGRSLAVFRACLEVQDPEPIEEAAANLRYVLEALRQN